MKKRVGTVGWWYWAITLTLLALWLLFGNQDAIAAAIGLTVVQAIHFALRAGDPVSFSVQVRSGYLALLVLGLFPPLRFIHWIQLLGTTALVTVDYCPLARALVLLPWNRRQPFSLALVRRVFFSRPAEGSIRDVLAREAEAEETASREAARSREPVRA